jgi:hypothetical protein
MIRRALGLMAFGGGLVLVAACGDDDPPAAKFPTADAFCAGKAAEECKAVGAACSVTDDKCKDARKSACMTAAGAATGQGRTYRPANADTCIAKTTEVYKDRTIDAVKEEAFKLACERVFTGAKKKSEICTNAYDCEGTLSCDLGRQSATEGFCADKVEKKTDEPCNNPGDTCAKGLYCQQRGGSRFCTAKNKLGDTCNLADAPCLEDLRCNATSCVALQAAGQPCDTSAECTTGFCNPDRKCQARLYASETGTCKDFGGI